MTRIKMRTGRIPERREVERAILAMAKIMRTARGRRIRRAVGKGPQMGMVQRMGRGKGRGWKWRKGRGKGRERGKDRYC
jgi:hypothetical protein